MRYLLISLFVLVLSSCNSLSITKDFVVENKQKTVTNTYFSDISKDYVYKAKIQAKKNNFGGLLIIKKINDKHHRVVFTTEFGNKIFDFEFINNLFKVNYVIDKLDRKIILNALRKDFQLLVNESNISNKKFTKGNAVIYKTVLNKKDNYFFIDKNTKAISKIIMASKRKKKITIRFTDIVENTVKKIELKHHNFDMTIRLQKI